MDSGRVRERLDIPRFWWRGAERTRPPAAVVAPTVAVGPLQARPRRGAGPALVIEPAPEPDRAFAGGDALIAEARARPAPSRNSGGATLAVSVAAAALLGATAFVMFGVSGGKVQAFAPISEQVDQLMIMAGLGVDEIRLSGHRYTIDNDVFVALALQEPTSLLRYNSDAARRRVEALSWVSRATVTRVLPNTVEVHISERTPIAVWLHDTGATLVDAEGRQLARVAPSTLPALPRIAGAGAPEAAGTLVAALASFPDIARRVTVSTRVGQRRWSLDTDNGSRIHLPADGETAALARLIRIATTTGALMQTAATIDLRIDERITVAPRRADATSSVAPDPVMPRKSASAL
jgi:cell division protein FtsQ